MQRHGKQVQELYSVIYLCDICLLTILGTFWNCFTIKVFSLLSCSFCSKLKPFRIFLQYKQSFIQPIPSCSTFSIAHEQKLTRSSGQSDQFPFGWRVFPAWDCLITARETAENKIMSIATIIKVSLPYLPDATFIAWSSSKIGFLSRVRFWLRLIKYKTF